jgi:hypothetical protein
VNTDAPASVDLYWIPLGAGARVVRLSGNVYERLCAWLQRRPRRDLYHSALIVTTTQGRFVIEMAPVIDGQGREDRGVVAEAPVGTRWARHIRAFRYEIRRWHDGVIPDITYAVASPVRVTDEPHVAERLVDMVPFVPTPVWGRDELHAGEMWNSNSVTSWLLEIAGVTDTAGEPPHRGRAPGWDAGVIAARHGRQPRGGRRLRRPRVRTFACPTNGRVSPSVGLTST